MYMLNFVIVLKFDLRLKKFSIDIFRVNGEIKIFF